MKLSKRGTDKPIEIFIALFVILAVAMVILKMFSSQIEQKREEMERQQNDERAKLAQQDLDTYCDSLCSKAQRSLKDKVTFCTSYYRGEVDINRNGLSDYTTALDNIQGYCEDRIYCAAYRPCGSLDPVTCKLFTCDYLENNLNAGSSDEGKAARLVGYDPVTGHYEGFYQPGECWSRISDEEKAMHWFTNFLAVPDISNPGGRCFFEKGTCYDRELQLNAYAATWGADCLPIS